MGGQSVLFWLLPDAFSCFIMNSYVEEAVVRRKDDQPI